MKASVLIEKYGFEKISDSLSDPQINHAFIGDLLSWVMGHAKSDDAWITILGHPNIIAVALLRELACVIIAHDAQIQPETIEKANEEDFLILKSPLSSFEISKILISEGV
jgi:hypothetical protein